MVRQTGYTMVDTLPPDEESDAVSVFVSYARADRPAIRRIVAAIEAAHYRVWWDALIEGGAAFAAAIEERLSTADAVVVAWSKAAVASDWVRDEAGHGRDRKRLVAISLDGTPPPLGFRQYHVVDLSGWLHDRDPAAIDALLRSIAAVAGADYQPAPAAPTRLRVTRRSALTGGTGVAVAAALAGIVSWAPWRSGIASNSIAVLPFANLSGDSSQAYFSDGLSEELRAALAHDPALRVAAPTSSNLFKSEQGFAKDIGQKLGVAYLLEGSVRRAGPMIRVAAELIDASSGFTSWSQIFDRTIDDIFAVQSSIATTVAGALAARVSHPAAPTAPGGTSSVAAYDAYLRGRALFDADIDERSDRSALDQFDIAIAADPGYAGAHAARSRVLSAIASEYAAPSGTAALYAQAIASAQRAVALAPNLAAAQLALGLAVYMGRLDIAAARAPYDRAAALGRGDADVQYLYAIYCSRSGRPADAAAAIARATELDRLNPHVFRTAGLIRYAARDYADSIPLSQQALALNPTLRVVHANIGNALLMLGRLDEARAAYLAEPLDLSRLPGLAIVERRLGHGAAAQTAMETLVRTLGDTALYQQVQVLAQWGDRDAAIATLDRARRVGDPGLLTAATDPLLDPIRADSRFSQLLGGLHLT